MKKRIIVVIVAVILALVIIMLFVINPNNGYYSYTLKTSINNVTEGYNYILENIMGNIQGQNEKYNLAGYSISYTQSEEGASFVPLYFDYYFNVDKDKTLYSSYMRIELKKNKVEIYNIYNQRPTRSLSAEAEAAESGVKSPDMDKILKLFKEQFGENSVNDILETNKGSIMCLSKIFIGKTYPKNDLWDISFEDDCDIRTHPYNKYFSCVIDMEIEQIVSDAY